MSLNDDLVDVGGAGGVHGLEAGAVQDQQVQAQEPAVSGVVDVQTLAIDAQRPVGLDCACRRGTVESRDRGTAVVREATVKKCVYQLSAKTGARDRAFGGQLCLAK